MGLMLKSVATTNSGSSAAPSVTLPSNGIVGELLVVYITHNDGTVTTADNNGATPMTEDYDSGNDAGGMGVAIYTRVITGSEPATLNFTLSTTNRWAITSYILAGAPTSSYYDVSISSYNYEIADTTPDFTGCTTNTNGSWVMLLGGIDSSSTTWSGGPGGSWVQIATVNSQQPLIAYYLPQATAGAVSNAAAAISAGSNSICMNMFVIKAAPLTTSWTVSSQIQADHTKVSGASDLTNFPVLIKDGNIPASVYSAMQSAGQDLRITTDSAGTTEIPFEIVSITPGSSLAEVWAKVPTLLTASATSLYLWAGNANAIAYDANAPFGSQAVWSGHRGVWHNEGSSFDDTVNAYAGTDSNITYNTTNGKLSQGAGFNGTSSNVTGSLVALSTYDVSGITVSCWVNLTNTNDCFIFSTASGAGVASWGGVIIWISSTKWTYRFGNGVASNDFVTTTAPTSGTWHYLTIVHAGSTNKFYLNGSEISNNTRVDSMVASGAGYNFGSNGNVNNWYNGKLDEVRVISGTALTADWIATEYANQNDPSTFWSTVSGVRLLGLLGCGT